MDILLKLIPSSIINLIGLGAVLFFLNIAWSFTGEIGKKYFKNVFNGKEKRHENRSDYVGFERRAENKGVEAAIMLLVEKIGTNNDLIERFIEHWKEKVPDSIDAVDEIKRQQTVNWRRLFDEELPKLRPH